MKPLDLDSIKYRDIINMEHPTSMRHPRMSMQARAAQFSPFAALSGHEEAIHESARLTDRKIELGEDALEQLNRKFAIVAVNVGTGRVFGFEYFVPDTKKFGGSYVRYDGAVKKIDSYQGTLTLTDHTVIEINQISDILMENV